MKTMLTAVFRHRIRRPGVKRLYVLAAAVPAAVFAAACSDMGQQNIFEPEVGHPASWVSDHGAAALSDGSSCPDCHGPDLSGNARPYTARYEHADHCRTEHPNEKLDESRTHKMGIPYCSG